MRISVDAIREHHAPLPAKLEQLLIRAVSEIRSEIREANSLVVERVVERITSSIGMRDVLSETKRLEAGLEISHTKLLQVLSDMQNKSKTSSSKVISAVQQISAVQHAVQHASSSPSREHLSLDPDLQERLSYQCCTVEEVRVGC